MHTVPIKSTHTLAPTHTHTLCSSSNKKTWCCYHHHAGLVVKVVTVPCSLLATQLVSVILMIIVSIWTHVTLQCAFITYGTEYNADYAKPWVNKRMHAYTQRERRPPCQHPQGPLCSSPVSRSLINCETTGMDALAHFNTDLMAVSGRQKYPWVFGMGVPSPHTHTHTHTHSHTQSHTHTHTHTHTPVSYTHLTLPTNHRV